MFLQAPPETPAAARIYQSDLGRQGYVTNLSRLWAWRPEVYQAFAALRLLLTGASPLSPRELGVLVCATAAWLGDPYCGLAWGTRLAGAADESLAAAVLQGASCEAMTPRERALAAWARKVAGNPAATTHADVEALRAAGLAEREIFEATAVVAFRLACSTVSSALGAQPDWQLVATAPRRVRAAVVAERPGTPQTA